MAHATQSLTVCQHTRLPSSNTSSLPDEHPVRPPFFLELPAGALAFVAVPQGPTMGAALGFAAGMSGHADESSPLASSNMPSAMSASSSPEAEAAEAAACRASMMFLEAQLRMSGKQADERCDGVREGNGCNVLALIL